MRNLKFTSLVAFFIFILLQSCKDNSIQLESEVKKEIVINAEQDRSKEISIDHIIDNYAKQLSNAEIKIVDFKTCSQTENNFANYENGISSYGYYSIKENSLNGKLEGDLNGDKKLDYIANYSCENCYGGIGSGNFLSNCFFLTSKDNKISVNEEMTNDFKQKLIDVITKDFGSPYFVKAEKEIMINGIEFTEIKNQVAYGKFSINTEACQGSPFPCVEGTFEYDVKNNTLKMTGQVTDNL